MEITRVVIRNTKAAGKTLAYCAVVLDNCLKLDGIELCETEELGKFLTFPSKQDVYKSILAINKGIRITLPKNRRVSDNPKRKKFEEFYYPVSSDFYIQLLNAISDAYNDVNSSSTAEGNDVIS